MEQQVPGFVPDRPRTDQIPSKKDQNIDLQGFF